jgi:hypothetical protein
MADLYETLRVNLAQEELVTRAQELARHLAETTQLEDRAAREADQRLQHIRIRRAREATLARDVALGSEERPVLCFEAPRWSERLVDVIRADNHEVVRTRVMRPEERQQQLSLVRDDDSEVR